MNSKDNKIDVRTPDAFHTFSERLFHWIEQYARAIGAVFALAIVFAIGWVAFGHYRDSVEKKASEAIARPENELKDVEAKLREARAAKMQELAGVKGAKEEPKPADYNKDYAPTVAKLTEQIKAHANTKAAMVSAMNLANFLVQQKQFEAAEGVLEAPKYTPSSDDLIAGFWHMHRGLVFLENQKADQALAEYKKILDSKVLKYFHPEALLKTGVALELKGDREKARETYQRLEKEFQGTEASSAAQQYLRLLDLKSQQG